MDIPSTTVLLRRARDGDGLAAAELFPLVYEQLRRIAHGYLDRAAPGHTLEPTALVHEAYLRMIDQSQLEVADRSHFTGIAARVMRLVLVDHTRRRTAAKRGGGRARVPLQDLVAFVPALEGLDLLCLDEALEKLESLDERKARIVDLRIFLGMTVNEAAEVLGFSPKTVEKDWTGARAWLRAELGDG